MQSGLNSIVNQQVMVVAVWTHQEKRTKAPFWKHITQLLLCTEHWKSGNKPPNLHSLTGKSLNQGFQAHKISLIFSAVLHSEMPKLFSVEFSTKLEPVWSFILCSPVYSFQQFLNDISNQLLTLVELWKMIAEFLFLFFLKIDRWVEMLSESWLWENLQLWVQDMREASWEKALI